MKINPKAIQDIVNFFTFLLLALYMVIIRWLMILNGKTPDMLQTGALIVVLILAVFYRVHFEMSLSEDDTKSVKQENEK